MDSQAPILLILNNGVTSYEITVHVRRWKKACFLLHYLHPGVSATVESNKGFVLLLDSTDLLRTCSISGYDMPQELILTYLGDFGQALV